MYSIIAFSIDLTIARNGSSMSTDISIPVFPTKVGKHTSFTVGYCQAVFKANGSDEVTSISAAAYGDTNSIYLVGGFSGRTWNLHQGELTGNGALVISGCYIEK